MLREVLVYPEILSSRKVCSMKPHAQLFYRNLMHACDGAGVFENDPKLLAAYLYPTALDRVNKDTVARWLMECQQAGLIAFYTDDKGRALGRFVVWKQKDLRRKRRYEAEKTHSDELPALFTATSPPNGSACARRNEMEEKSPHSPPPAGGGHASPVKAARFRRAQRLDTLNDERERLEAEMRDILRPGGCAYNVLPSGEKAERLKQLQAAHAELLAAIGKRRAELARE